MAPFHFSLDLEEIDHCFQNQLTLLEEGRVVVFGPESRSQPGSSLEEGLTVLTSVGIVKDSQSSEGLKAESYMEHLHMSLLGLPQRVRRASKLPCPWRVLNKLTNSGDYYNFYRSRW